MVNNDIILNGGKDIAFNRAFGDATQSKPIIARFGRVQDDILITDTALSNQITITGTEQVDSCDATTGWVGSTDITLSVNTTTFKEGTGAINFEKSGATETTVTSDKTVTSLDFTDKFLHFWLYIDQSNVTLAASGDTIEIRYGSDSSNYFTKTYTTAEYTALQVGNWADLYFDDSESATGAPVVASMDYFQLRIVIDSSAQTWSAGDVIYDDIRIASDDDYQVAQDAGFPTNDLTNREQTRQYTLTSVVANGYNIDGYFEENSDSTPVGWSMAKFPDESKADTDQFIFISKDRII